MNSLLQRGVAPVRIALVVAYAICIAYVGAVALNPGTVSALPENRAWFGQPGSYATLLVVLALPALYLLLRRLTGRQVFSGGPLFVVAGMVISTVFLGMTAYWRCHSGQSAFFAPLAWTLGLFVGSVENPFAADAESVCRGLPMPLALELARLLGIAATLTTAVAAAMTLFRSQFDRIVIWRAQSVVVAVGIDEQAVSLIGAIQRNKSRGETVVALTGNGEREVVKMVRRLGVRVREVDLDDDESLTSLKLWKRLERLYLLSEDPARNLKRYLVIDRYLADIRSDRLRLPLTVRIEDPWQAEQWRRSFLAGGERRWVADAVGPYEISAAKLVRHLTTAGSGTPTSHVLLCGLNDLTYALSSEFAQVWRESQLYKRPGVHLPPNIVIMAQGAESFVRDHDLKQRTLAADAPLSVSALGVEPGVPEIEDYLGQLEAARSALVFTDPSTEHRRMATRLALRFPDLKIYQASAVAETLTNTSVIGHLYTYPITMELDHDAPQDVWERAAELIHEVYSKTTERDTPTTEAWKDLHPFVRGSNRRQVLNALWMVEKLTDLTWDSLQSPPAEPLPPEFSTKSTLEQLEWLGLSEDIALQLAEAEHDDWSRYHKAEGWKHDEGRGYDAQESFERRLHKRLLPWDELMASPAHDDNQRRALSSLLSCLLNLRILGYRAVPKRRHYRRLGEVVAEQRTLDWTWNTSAGELMHGTAGDWSVTDRNGTERSVATDVFAGIHEPLGGNRYRRSGSVTARRVIRQETIHTREGDAAAHPGDYVVTGAAGEQWPVPRSKFLETYELIEDR